MTEKSFRRSIAPLGYSLHKHRGADLFDLIDLKGNFLVLGDATLEQIAEHVAALHFPAKGGDTDG